VNSILISVVDSTPLISLPSKTFLIDRIELEGSGKLAVCTLSFFNGDELSMDEYQNIIFTKTDHPTQYILTPHKLINLSDYFYCSLKIFSGKLHVEDKVILYYKD
jgi:hypothetical protein